jgi:chromate transport protein ChrA
MEGALKNSSAAQDNADSMPSWREVFLYFLRLGFINIGGPVAQITMMYNHMVERRHWLSDDRFVRIMAFCHMLPGPEALQLAIYVGYLKKKLVGGILAGLTFILPGALIMIALSWIYVAYSGLPQVNDGLYILKPAVLGIIAAGILNFIPYIGPWIAAAMPIGLSMAISTGWIATFLTVGLFVVLEFINNHVLEPWLYGKNTGVSAVAVLVAAVFWMWLWGPVGLLLATPLTVCVLVVGKHVPQLSFLDILLGTEPVFEPKTRIYQRLLAGDQEEAAELFENYLEHQSVVEVYDTVLIPALALAERHWQFGELNEGKHKFITESLKEMIQDRGERQQEARTKEDTADAQEVGGDPSRVDGTNSSQFSILCVPARDDADEIAAMMLAQVLEKPGCLVKAVSVTSLAGEMVDLVDHCTADVVCISATPPAAVMHARYLCKRLHARLPELKLVVGLWDAQGDLNKSRERIGCGAIVVATLADAQEQIRLLTESRLPPSEKRAQSDGAPMVMVGANS